MTKVGRYIREILCSVPNSIKYSVSAQTLALKKGNFYIGTGDVGKGPTSTTGYYNGITPPYGGYTIYLNKASQGPSIYSVGSDAGLISLTNRIAGASYTTAAQCLTYFATQTDKMVFNADYPAIVTDGLVLNLDAGFTPSYPTTGSTWYDLSGNGNNGTLINGPTYNPSNGGSFFLDGTDDVIRVTGTQTALQTIGTGDFTMCLWVKIDTTQTGNEPKILFNNKNAPAAAAGYGIDYFYGGGNNGKLLWSTGNGSSAVEIFSQNSFTSILGNWAYLVMVRQNGATNNGHFYVNGVYEPLASSATVLNVNTATNMTLGNTADSFGSYFTRGNFANAKIYNRALSASEIQQNYNAQKGRFLSIVTDGLIMNLNAGNTSSYPGTGTLWTDLSGQNNNATLVNGPAFSSSDGGVITFDGTNDSAQWASEGAITSNLNTWYNDTSRTLQMWIKFSNLTQGLIQSVTSPSAFEEAYGFAMTNSRWAMFANGSSSTAGGALSTNTWYFVTVLRTGSSSWTVYQGTTNIGNISLNAGTTDTDNDWQFQLMCNGYGNHKQGTVGQVLFYNKTLSAAEIENNYNATKTRFGL